MTSEEMEGILTRLANASSEQRSHLHVQTNVLLALVSSVGQVPELATRIQSNLEHGYSGMISASLDQIAVDAYEEHAQLFRLAIEAAKELAAQRGADTA